jgi:hypothetical protein
LDFLRCDFGGAFFFLDSAAPWALSSVFLLTSILSFISSNTHNIDLGFSWAFDLLNLSFKPSSSLG